MTCNGRRYLGIPCLAAAVILFVAVPAGCTQNPSPDREPLQIGAGKQLFIDDRVVETTESVSRVLNRPVKHPGGPVLRPERKWEGNFAAVSSVIYDPEDALFKMWYVPSLITAQRPPGPLEEYENLLRASNYREELDLSCYATSRDGIHWKDPNWAWWSSKARPATTSSRTGRSGPKAGSTTRAVLPMRSATTGSRIPIGATRP